MAFALPTIPDDKINFFREQLYREISQLFIWEGLPEEIPLDYLERTLIRFGSVMFFKEEESYGYMATRCGVREVNIYEKPIIAFSVTPTQDTANHYRERIIAHSFVKDIDPDKMCVLIENMYRGQNISEIVDFYALRLALLFQAFDTNALWQSAPYLFRVKDSKLRLSVEKLFADIFSGKPMVVIDKEMLGDGDSVKAEMLKAEFNLDKILDTVNELKSKFYETIGITTVGVDKRERLVQAEAISNEQRTQTALAIMYEQRLKACKDINRLYPELSPTVKIRGGVENGFSDDGTEERIETQ